MAKVDSINSSTSFYVNKSSFPKSKFGLEITEDGSPKCNFDISSLLSDNETFLEKQITDNNYWHGKKNDNKDGRCSSVTSLNTESPTFVSLGALAENHLKKNKMFPELNSESDFDLSDLLSNDDCPRNLQCESDNLFELCLLTEDDYPTTGKTLAPNNDISFDDLSNWINSSVTQIPDSVECVHNHNFSFDFVTGKPKSLSSVSLQRDVKDTYTDIQNLDCFENIQENSSINKISKSDLVNTLREVSIDNLDTTDISASNSKIDEPTNEISDSDFLPDIDLTFCIKKNSKKDFSFYGDSPETVDSGFDESNFIPDKLSSPTKEHFFYKDVLVPQNGICNKSVISSKVKQSLFSKAISAKPKIDDSRKSKLKNVMNELLKGTIPLHPCVQHINSKENQRIIDHSNEHVIVSSYLKFTDEK